MQTIEKNRTDHDLNPGTIRSKILELLDSLETHKALIRLTELFPESGQPLLDAFDRVKKRYEEKEIDINQRNNEYSLLSKQAAEMLKSIFE